MRQGVRLQSPKEGERQSANFSEAISSRNREIDLCERQCARRFLKQLLPSGINWRNLRRRKTLCLDAAYRCDTSRYASVSDTQNLKLIICITDEQSVVIFIHHFYKTAILQYETISQIFNRASARDLKHTE